MWAIGYRIRAIAFLGLMAFTAAAPAAAQPLSLMWDPSANPAVSGYMVYVRIPGAQATPYDAGNATSFQWNGAVTGQQYYFSVASYSPGPVIGPRSPEISRFPNSAPALLNPGAQTTTVGTAVTLQLQGSDPDGSTITYGATGRPSGLQLATGTGHIAGTPSTAGSYLVTVSVSDGALSTAKTFTWTIAQPSTSAPTTGTGGSGTTTPTPTAPRDDEPSRTANSAPSLSQVSEQTSTRGTNVVLQLTGSDPEGSPLSYGASGLPPGLQIASSTGRISGSPSRSGNYAVTATVSDGQLSAARTFEWAIIEPTSDTIAPVVSIAVPTAGSTFSTDETSILIGGSVRDDSSVIAVEWSSDRGVEGSASGKENWIATIPLVSGSNTIRIRARDAAGNVGTTSIVVKRSSITASPGTSKKRDRLVSSTQ